MSLRVLIAAVALATGLLVGQSPAGAESGGCLKYGAVGAAGGHLAGHGVMGALAGCGAGMWTRHEARKHAADEQNATAELNSRNRAPEYQNNADAGAANGYGSNSGGGQYSSNRPPAPTPFYRQ